MYRGFIASRAAAVSACDVSRLICARAKSRLPLDRTMERIVSRSLGPIEDMSKIRCMVLLLLADVFLYAYQISTVYFESLMSVIDDLPVSVSSANMSRMSSLIWNALPTFIPYSMSIDIWPCGAPASSAPTVSGEQKV